MMGSTAHLPVFLHSTCDLHPSALYCLKLNDIINTYKPDFKSVLTEILTATMLYKQLAFLLMHKLLEEVPTVPRNCHMAAVAANTVVVSYYYY